VESTGFDEAALPQQYAVSYSGSYWVQLNHVDDPSVSIVVGIVPSQPASDLDAAVKGQLQDLAPAARPSDRESGSVESATLGPMRWYRTRYEDEEGVERVQLALFGAHPADSCLVVARSEYPADTPDAATKLDELLEIVSVVGPGL
jgi:hypothetical protein